MKKILSLLTLALLGAATTVFAGTPYTEESFLADETYTDNFDQLLNPEILNSGNRNGTYNFKGYSVTFEDWSKLKISVGDKNINFYVYDFVDNVGSGTNVSALKGTAPSPVQQIGYREIGATDGSIHALGDSTDSEVVKRYYADGNKQPYQVVRNSYYLGEFEANKEYELYVSYNADGTEGKWSYYNAAGGYLIQKDALMSVYVSQNFNSSYNAASDKYTALVQVNNKSFGLRSGPAPAVDAPVGQPLPGGLQIALFAGLFGLGFYYVRRKKSVAV